MSPCRPASRRTGRRRASAAVAALLLALSACADDPTADSADGSAPTPSASSGTSTGETDPAPAADDPAGADSGDAGPGTPGASAGEPAPAEPRCEGLEARSVGPVAAGSLTEASGLAPSSRHPGTIWAHNDSGHDVVLYGLDLAGGVVAEVPIPVDGVDIEDMAIADGVVYLADIGDNDRVRDDVAIHRFPEPDLSGEAATGVETIRLRYPDGPHDAEALLVDPASGTIVIVEKEFQIGGGGGDGLLSPTPAGLYTATPPFPPGETVELTRSGTVALDELNLATTADGPTEGLVAALGVDGLATSADVSADGSVIAVRTYATVWLFPRAEGQSLVDALAGSPCEAPTVLEQQGEAVAFTDAAGTGFVTLGEGAGQPLNLTERTG